MTCEWAEKLCSRGERKNKGLCRQSAHATTHVDNYNSVRSLCCQATLLSVRARLCSGVRVSPRSRVYLVGLKTITHFLLYQDSDLIINTVFCLTISSVDYCHSCPIDQEVIIHFTSSCKIIINVIVILIVISKKHPLFNHFFLKKELIQCINLRYNSPRPNIRKIINLWRICGLECRCWILLHLSGFHPHSP